jgi:antitoxin YefM
MQVLSFFQVQARLEEVIDHVCRHNEPTVITRERGGPVVVISLKEYTGLQETLHLLGSIINGKRLRESLDELRLSKEQALEADSH